MKTTLFALAVLVPALARADDGRNRPYALINGRSAGTAAARVLPPAAPQTRTASMPTTTQRSTQAMVGRRAASGRPQGHQSLPTLTEAPPPPYFSKPGALIRTEGQQPKYTDAAPARTHTIEGGSFINIDDRKALDVGRAPGPHQGPKDTLPSSNPGNGGGTGGSSVTPNSTTNITNNTTTNGNQNGGGGSGGTGFDPAF